MFRLLLAFLLCIVTEPTWAQTTKKKPPTKTETTKTDTTKTEASKTADGKININMASASELMKLNGVGEVTAKNIIAYREANGPFKSVDDLNKVKGIGDKTLAKFREQVSLGDGSVAAPSTTPPPTETKTTTPTVSAEAKININTASASELMKLNGVGEVTAQKIIAYREANGPFKSVDDLSKVTGIGPKTLEKFRAQATIDGNTKPTETTVTTPTETKTTATPTNKININTAGIAELNKLNGVGDTTAKNIIAYREANGPFKSIEDLNKVKGIGDKTLEKFREQITIGDGAAVTTPTNTGTPTVTVAPVKPAGPLVNINTADLKELGKLPGVGDTTAKNIIAYREANGPFKSCKDLNNVKGIGDKTLEKIEPSCTTK